MPKNFGCTMFSSNTIRNFDIYQTYALKILHKRHGALKRRARHCDTTVCIQQEDTAVHSLNSSQTPQLGQFHWQLSLFSPNHKTIHSHHSLPPLLSSPLSCLCVSQLLRVRNAHFTYSLGLLWEGQLPLLTASTLYPYTPFRLLHLLFRLL